MELIAALSQQRQQQQQHATVREPLLLAHDPKANPANHGEIEKVHQEQEEKEDKKHSDPTSISTGKRKFNQETTDDSCLSTDSTITKKPRLAECERHHDLQKKEDDEAILICHISYGQYRGQYNTTYYFYARKSQVSAAISSSSSSSSS